MKEIEVQTENKDKEIIKSSVIKIDEKSDRIKVIVSVGSSDHMATLNETSEVHKYMCKAIEDSKVITIPNWIKINTIKI